MLHRAEKKPPERQKAVLQHATNAIAELWFIELKDLFFVPGLLMYAIPYCRIVLSYNKLYGNYQKNRNQPFRFNRYQWDYAMVHDDKAEELEAKGLWRRAVIAGVSY